MFFKKLFHQQQKKSNSVWATITDIILSMVLTLWVYTKTEEGESANNMSFTTLSKINKVITINWRNAEHVCHIQSKKKRFRAAMKRNWLGPQVLCCHFSILTWKPLKCSKTVHLKSAYGQSLGRFVPLISLWLQLFWLSLQKWLLLGSQILLKGLSTQYFNRSWIITLTLIKYELMQKAKLLASKTTYCFTTFWQILLLIKNR